MSDVISLKMVSVHARRCGACGDSCIFVFVLFHDNPGLYKGFWTSGQVDCGFHWNR